MKYIKDANDYCSRDVHYCVLYLSKWFAHLLLPDMRPGICFSVGLRGFKKHINDLPALKVHNISEFSPALSRCTMQLHTSYLSFFSTYTIFG